MTLFNTESIEAERNPMHFITPSQSANLYMNVNRLLINFVMRTQKQKPYQEITNNRMESISLSKFPEKCILSEIKILVDITELYIK